MKPLLVPGAMLILLLLGCSDRVPTENIKAQKADIIGTWLVDEDAMKESMGCNPIDRAGLALYKSMSIKITPTQVIVNLTILKESKTFKGTYKVDSLQDNIVKVRALSGPEKGKVSKIEFLNRNQIRFEKEGDDSPTLIMKRSKE